jgi:hypothetical protein
MNRLLLRFSLAILILFGFYLLFKILYVYPKYDGKNPLNVNMIESQLFTINPESDTVIIGIKGTLLKINKNTFHDCKGNRITGKIEIELKEIVSENDLILSGLTTTSDGKLLETGGMIFINANQDSKQLCMNEDNKIGVLIPVKEKNMKMKVFSGTLFNDTINWQNPVPLLNNPDSVFFGAIPEDLLDKFGFERAKYISISRGIIKWNIPHYVDSLMKYYDSLFQEYNRTENDVYYAFETRKINWINIDRFIEQNETEEVDFSLIVANNDNFQETFIRLIFVDLQSTISANQINQNQFVIGKSKDSKVQLPIKKKAIILATAYCRGKPYYDLKEITIQKNQVVELNLKKINPEEFRKNILSNL